MEGLEKITEWKDTWGKMQKIEAPEEGYVVVKVTSNNANLGDDAYFFDHWHGCQSGAWFSPNYLKELYDDTNDPHTARCGEIYAVKEDLVRE